MMNEEIVVKHTDKGGAIVLMDKSKYLKELYRQLDDGEDQKFLVEVLSQIICLFF